MKKVSHSDIFFNIHSYLSQLYEQANLVPMTAMSYFQRVTKTRIGMTDSIGIALLAAGKGTRLKIDTPKPLLPLLGKCMVDYVIDTTSAFASEIKAELAIGVVVGHAKEDVKSYLSAKYKSCLFAEQIQQLGTADAMRAYFDGIPSAREHAYTLIACADTPLLSAQSLVKMYRELKTKRLKAIAATFNLQNASGYGRIKRSAVGFKIVEQKDANADELMIKEVNSGLYLVETKYLFEMLKRVNNNNKSGEFYLTDIFQENQPVEALLFDNPNEFLGVNSLVDWELVRSQIQHIKNQSLMLTGVMIQDSKSTHIDWDVKVGMGSIIEPGVILSGKTHVGEKVTVESYSVVVDTVVESNVTIHSHSHLAGSHLRSGCSVGPFARVRPGSDFSGGVKIGNFVETKNAVLHSGVKVSHLSYVGDAEIGENTNLGCGFITCNYDGVSKFKTKIGANCFIGSDVQMIAPIEIGSECFVAAGSTITQGLKNGDFAVARGRQITKSDMAKKFLKKKS
jgi:bifunctional UDP-N-acetylglucosamine pyrophosphorylase/glucosamine-1-phosphate N-acetyltransferase